MVQVFCAFLRKDIQFMEKYTKKKFKNQLLKSLIDSHVTEKTFERVVNCNSFLIMVADKTMEKRVLLQSKKI